MKIYVDFDDCLCETARHLSHLAAELFGKIIPYENMRYFDLKKTFSLTDEQYELLMSQGHRPEVLLSYVETPGASETINSWIDCGYDVSIITGRPCSAYEPSREWLNLHGLERAKLYCLNKYGRDGFYQRSVFSLEIEDYYKLRFDFAIEDSPAAFRFFEHLPALKVLVYDRPWNRECALPQEGYTRCTGWDMIKNIVG